MGNAALQFGQIRADPGRSCTLRSAKARSTRIWGYRPAPTQPARCRRLTLPGSGGRHGLTLASQTIVIACQLADPLMR